MRPVSQEVLKRFWEDKGTLEEVKSFFFAHLDALGLERIYAKDDTIGVADAKKVLENAFAQMDELFEVENINKKERLNEAR